MPLLVRASLSLTAGLWLALLLCLLGLLLASLVAGTFVGAELWTLWLEASR